jgi:hypothetical protein
MNPFRNRQVNESLMIELLQSGLWNLIIVKHTALLESRKTLITE